MSSSKSFRGGGHGIHRGNQIIVFYHGLLRPPLVLILSIHFDCPYICIKSHNSNHHGAVQERLRYAQLNSGCGQTSGLKLSEKSKSCSSYQTMPMTVVRSYLSLIL